MKLDVIVTSTCRKTIEKTIRSFLNNVSCSKVFNFIVNIDVKYPGYLSSLKEYLKRLDIDDVHINIHPKAKPNGLTKTINYLYNKIQTPYYFNLEDDWLFLKQINLDKLIDIMECHPHIDIIRFNKESIKGEAWLYHLSPINAPKTKKNLDKTIHDVNLVQTHTWSLNPSIVRTATMKRMLPVPDDTRAETYLCHQYDQLFSTRGAYFLGQIGDPAIIRDIGRSDWFRFKKFLKRKIL